MLGEPHKTRARSRSGERHLLPWRYCLAHVVGEGLLSPVKNSHIRGDELKSTSSE